MAEFSIGPVAVLTGAGISAESGIPTFRGRGDLWRGHRPEALATPEAFDRDPALVWAWYDWRRTLISAGEPNAAHATLAEIEAATDGFALITQNVDGLHQAAGSRNVIELHGNIWRTRCSVCNNRVEDRRVPLPEIPPHCERCGQVMRPDVVWFGEPLPGRVLEDAMAVCSHCRTMLVIGTSAIVQPAASLPLMALEHGAQVIEINPVETPLAAHAHDVLRGPAAKMLPLWWREVGRFE